ncbi:MAG TPA: DUF6265 family protein [Thermoanaerobaculia bacterium]|nr:DUF6265 family protein [Thermoanaerobaculia bacterium]
MRRSNRWLPMAAAALALTLLAFPAPSAAADGPAAKVTDLAWMTGSWKGAMGPGTLEENWSRPDAGSIASLVRGTAGGKTHMIELIVIEESEGSLLLRLQQWNPGFQPRTPGPQEMRLVAIAEREASFEATGEGGLEKLTYSRPADDTFVVSVVTDQGAEIAFELKRQ